MQTALKQAKKIAIEFNMKEALLVGGIMALGLAAMAWGSWQMAPQKPAALSANDQCRAIGNAIFSGDPQTLVSHLDDADKRAFGITDKQMGQIHEKVIAPRLAQPVAWQPSNYRIYSCDGEKGIISLGIAAGESQPKRILSLHVRRREARVTYRYQDFLALARSLDKASGLDQAALKARITHDARIMAEESLEGFDLLHPSREAKKTFLAQVKEVQRAKSLVEKSLGDLAVKSKSPLEQGDGEVRPPARPRVSPTSLPLSIE